MSSSECVNGNYCFQLDGYYYKTWKNYEMADYHKHNRIEIMFVLDGECFVLLLKDGVGQDDYTKIMLDKGEGIIIDSDVWHKLVVSEKCTIINFEFLIMPCVNPVNTIKAATYMSNELNEFLQSFKNSSNFYDKSNITQLVKLILFEAENNNAFSDHCNILNSYSNMLLIEIARSYRNKSIAKPYDMYVKKAIKYINAHVREKICIDDIAKYVDVGYAHLERLFKSRIGITLGDYIIQQKVDLAEKMLSNTTSPIEVIAVQLGFGSRQQFYNTFKKIKGISPQKYRYNQVDKDIWYGFSGDYAFEIMKSNKQNNDK